MAAVVISYTNLKNGVTDNGRRFVEATTDANTGDYATGGVALPLATLGLKTVSEAWLSVSARGTGEDMTLAARKTGANFYPIVDVADPTAPLLLLYSDSSGTATQHPASAVEATLQFRLRLVGTS